jgi:hypothetical protein
VYKVLVGKPEGKRPLGRPRRRWEDEVRMDLKKIGLGGCGLDSTVSGQGPVAGCCECGIEPSGSCATELVSLVRVDVCEPGSSVSILSGYGLEDREIEVRSPAEAKDFSFILCVQTDCGAHPASYTVGTGGHFPGAKTRPARDPDHSPPSSAVVKNE